MDDAYTRLSTRWPSRSEQIRRVLDFIGEPGIPMPPLLIYGGPSTGKTAIVKDVFKELATPYGYVSCVEFEKPRSLLQAILNRLKGKKRKCADGYLGQGGSEHMADFLVHIDSVGRTRVQYIVLDHVERIRDSEVLAVLLRLRELTGVDIGLILISQTPWGSNCFDDDTLRCRRPHHLCFPAYKMQELLQILELGMPEGEDIGLFRVFLSTFVRPMFARCSSRIEDLQRVIEQQFPEYVRPVREGRLQPSQQQQLYIAYKDKALAAKEVFENGLQKQIEGGLNSRGSAVGPEHLDFELPFTSKFLLLAAYVCSRNKPAIDRRLFDPSSRARRRLGAMASDKQAEAAAEAKLRGPHSFPLERLLATFWELRYGLSEDCISRDELEDAQSNEVMMQVSSLVSLRFLSQVSGDLDEVKYACNVSDELAERISKNVKVNLKDFVFYV